MTKLLVVDQLIEQAQRETGLDRFDSNSFREGLDILVSDFNACESVDSGVERMGTALKASLINRLKITKYLDDRPELLNVPIERPVFVFGIPRTGTTLLNNLLAADPGRRSPLSWEIDEPVPPATTATLYNDPRALAKLEAERAMLAARPEAGKFYRGSAIYPNEDVFIMANDFKTVMWESRGVLPNYRDWIYATDVTSAYEYHQRFLQVLQSVAPGTWNLKMPSHALNIPTILKLYPDARLIWAHRDPFTAVGSLCSLIKMSHMGHMGRIDIDWIAQDYPWQCAEHANRIMAARDEFGEDRVVDVHYSDLTRDPIGTMRRLYARLGDEFTSEAEGGMQAWVDDNAQDKFGRHEYKLDQFGLSKEKLEPLFDNYLSRYDIEREG